MARLGQWKWASSIFLLFVATTRLITPAQTLTTLVNFDNNNGADPFYISLVQGTDGNLYGTTIGGGDNFGGTAFKMNLSGALTTLYSFCDQPNCADGESPYAGLILATDGNFYGTTYSGGNGTFGTVFRLTPRGILTSLYRFSGIDGGLPLAPLVEATNGNFYGTTLSGGTGNSCGGGCGTSFEITPTGILTTLHSFDFDTDGQSPNGLIQGIDHSLFGTTTTGPNGGGQGTVFKLWPTGIVTTLHIFHTIDGATPRSGLTEGMGGFYGTTSNGTVYKVSRTGKVTVLAQVNGQPWAPLVQATDGNFYGTTISGGDLNCQPPSGCGTIYRVSPGGLLTILHKFEQSDGELPYGGLLQATNGVLYGTTTGGGSFSGGTIFSLDIGLGPFVAFVRDVGRIGGTGGILGQGFTGTTGVSLNGTPANFTVVSDTFLKATVPSGATTGFVTVTTPSGTLTSNRWFRVTPQLLSFDPPGGAVGTQVTITGVSLTQTGRVGFGNRLPAQFTVNSDTQVTATVPVGATTGKVGIETKGGIAISSGTFTVTQ